MPVSAICCGKSPLTVAWVPTDDPDRLDLSLDTLIPDNPNKPYDIKGANLLQHGETLGLEFRNGDFLHDFSLMVILSYYGQSIRPLVGRRAMNFSPRRHGDTEKNHSCYKHPKDRSQQAGFASCKKPETLDEAARRLEKLARK